MNGKIGAVRVVEAVYRGKITGEQIIVNIQVLLRESGFKFLVESVDGLIGNGGAVVSYRIDRHNMKVRNGIGIKKLLIIGNVSICFCDIVDTQIQDHGGFRCIGESCCQLAGSGVFQPFIAFSFFGNVTAGIGRIMCFFGRGHADSSGISDKDETVAGEFASFGLNVMGIQDQGNDQDNAKAGIEALQNFIKDELHLPTTLSEMNISDEKFDELKVKACYGQDSLPRAYRPLS